MTWKRPWIKLWTEMLDDPKLAILPEEERWAWVALLLVSARSPEPGKLLLPNGRPMTASQLWSLCRPVNLLAKGFQKALQTFEESNMVYWDGEVLVVTHWHARQDTQDATAAERKRRQRAHQRQANAHGVTPPVTPPVTPHVTDVTRDVTPSPLTTPLEKTEDRRQIFPDAIASGPRAEATQPTETIKNTETEGLEDLGQPAVAERPARVSGAVTSRRPKRGGNPQADAILEHIRQAWGQPIVKWGKEARSVNDALRLSYTPEQILACWQAAQESLRWRGQWMPMAYLVEDLGEWVKNGGASLRKWSWVPGQGRSTRVEPGADPDRFEHGF